MDGWIKIHRKIMECALWNGDEPSNKKSAWIDLLLMANHKEKQIVFKGQPRTIKAGQRLTSIRKLATLWNWSLNRVRRYLELLEELNMITVERDTNGTLITIVKYEVYQGERYATDTPTDTPMDTLTDTPTDTAMEPKQERKNDKNDKKNIYGEYHHVKLTDQELGKLQEEYGEEMTTACIVYLDEYIEMKGYKAKSHYLCIRKWVVDAVKEKRSKEAVVKKDTWNINRPADEYADLIKALEGDNDN